MAWQDDMRIAIVTDAWKPQVNGVVNTLSRTGEELEARGHTVKYFTAEGRRTVPVPSYPSIRLAVLPSRWLHKALDEFEPDAIHIATEGSMGSAARKYCLKRELRFTTSYHTQFPQYVRARVPIPEAVTYAAMRRFHGPAQRTLVATPTMREDLEQHGFEHVVLWSRGVDTELFKPRRRDLFDRYQKPIWMNMGRVAVEKNIEAFLDLELPGTKVVVGDGPDLEVLREDYPDVVFTGFKHGVELAQHLSSADCFVFPSRTDTFGLVLLEALACGTPVAAYPVVGPKDVLTDPEVAVMDEDLGAAALAALRKDREACRAFAAQHTWGRATDQFLANLVPVDEL